MSKPHPSFAPIYAACVYPEMATLFREHGYALAVHGSLQRDFDLVAIPWAEHVTLPEDLISHVTADWAVKVIGEVGHKQHGRRAWTLSFCGGCFVDLSFMPVIEATEKMGGAK